MSISTATSPQDSSASATGSSFQGAATLQSGAIKTLTAIGSSQQYPSLPRRGTHAASSAGCHLQRTASPFQSQSHAQSNRSESRFQQRALKVHSGSSAS